MNLRISPAPLAGRIIVPPSKSELHRLLICAALSEGESMIAPFVSSRDLEATMGCLRVLGADFSREGDGLAVLPCKRAGQKMPTFFCGESATTLRLLLPLALVLRGGGCFVGEGRLLQRPLEPYFALFRDRGIDYSLTERKLTVSGSLPAGDYALPGNVSSQFFSGLLLALPLVGASTLRAATPLESAPYAAMTAAVMARFGVKTEKIPHGWAISEGHYQAAAVTAEADWSQAAFWLAANFLGGRVELPGLSPTSPQGDRIITQYRRELNGSGAVSLSLAQCPDLLPALCVMAAGREGDTLFTHARRLRLKESDRLAACAGLLKSFGVSCQEGEDFLLVRGTGHFYGGRPALPDDHRLVMAAAILAAYAEGESVLTKVECAEKSYPAFFEDFQRLGGQCHAE